MEGELLLCPAEHPAATLITRCRRYAKELFTFVADPAVPMVNNPAEQALHSIVVALTNSGATRSPSGSRNRMVLASIAGTTTMRGQAPNAVFLHQLSHQH